MTQLDMFGDTPFYPKGVVSSKLATGTAVAAKNIGPDQKTLDEWHYKLNTVIEDLRDVKDPIDSRRDLEEIRNEINTYLRG